jgi:hypothetical protein
LAESERITQTFPASNFTDKFLKKPLERGFNIEYVKDSKGAPMTYTINHTMMRIDLASPMKGTSLSFSVKWSYNINDYQKRVVVPDMNHLKRRKQNICNCTILS